MVKERNEPKDKKITSNPFHGEKKTGKTLARSQDEVKKSSQKTEPQGKSKQMGGEKCVFLLRIK